MVLKGVKQTSSKKTQQHLRADGDSKRTGGRRAEQRSAPPSRTGNLDQANSTIIIKSACPDMRPLALVGGLFVVGLGISGICGLVAYINHLTAKINALQNSNSEGCQGLSIYKTIELRNQRLIADEYIPERLKAYILLIGMGFLTVALILAMLRLVWIINFPQTRRSD